MSEYVMDQRAREVFAEWHRQKGCSQHVVDDCLSGVIYMGDLTLELVKMALAAATDPREPAPATEGSQRDRVMGELEQWFDVAGVDLAAAAESVLAAAREPAPAVGEPWQMQLADALDHFWNPAVGAVQEASHYGPASGSDVICAMAQGFAAVAASLREAVTPPAPPVDAELQRDAERYRYLRDHAHEPDAMSPAVILAEAGFPVDNHRTDGFIFESDLDYAVDAAIQARRQQGDVNG